MPIATDFQKSVTRETFDSLVLPSVNHVAVEFIFYGCEHRRFLERGLQEVTECLSTRESRLAIGVIKC